MHDLTGADIFGVYRTTLAIVFGTYAVVKTVHFVLGWQAATSRASRPEAVLRRWLVVSLLKIRLRRLWWELIKTGLLAAVFFYLVWLQT